MKRDLPRKQKGFTLVELVVVIIILGILSATAAPRFFNLKGDARAALLNGARASVQSASVLAYATSLAQSLGATSPVTVNGQQVTMVFNYPSGAAGGIDNAVNLDTTKFAAATFAGGTATFAIAGTTSCSFTYAQAIGSVTGPLVGTLLTTGC